MSEVKLISPLLDGFSVGTPMSEHNGIRCCPAIKENTDKKYILKIISIPATQAQMDALLLAGAYKDPAGAMEYFFQTGEDIMKEAELLKTLSKLDGFLPYEGWQMEPITRRRLGYEVYLIGSYKRSLEKYLKSHPVTHLEAINLGLDLCAALSVCRDAGFIYAALKPSNVFVSEKKEYRIGDLGFISLDALKYTTLPEKYHSAYTPPELFDPMASTNLTVDTYALGMILYQLYNDGALPSKGKSPAEGPLPTPVNADYEIAEIIMKAINPDPELRWDSPTELGKALAAYMQRNAVNDIPITPHFPLDIPAEDIVMLSEDQDPSSEPDSTSDAVPARSSEISESPNEEASELPTSNESSDEPDTQQSEVIISPDNEYVSDQSESLPEETTAANPPDEPESISDSLSPETSEILSKADDLIAHETPEGINLPEPTGQSDPFSFVHEDTEEIEDNVIPEEAVTDTDEITPESASPSKEKKKKRKHFADPKYRRRAKRFAISLILILSTSILGMLGWLYYQNIYIQHIRHLYTEGTHNQITVYVETDADASELTVKCIDPYGNSSTQYLIEGKTVFSNLNPSTTYTIELEIEGFHHLTGTTSCMLTTESNTRISNFTSIAGSEDGSVVLNFTVDGDEPNDWGVYYSAEGEQEKRRTFTGHSVMINGLTIGKIYTFRLDPGENIVLSGETSIEVMASKLILAEGLSVSSIDANDITISWKTPGDVIVDSWTIRCYNGLGFDETVTTKENNATFYGIDPSSSYSVEVTAAGMTASAKTNITANPKNITNIDVDSSSYKKVKLSWDFSGTAPEGGWIVTYRIAGGEKKILTSKKATADIPLSVPGAKYEFVIAAADNTTVFNGNYSYTLPEADSFKKHNLTAEQLTVALISTPVETPWYCEDISKDMIADTFPTGSSVSVILSSADAFYQTGATVEILYTFEDTYGNILPEYIQQKSMQWKNIWSGGDDKNGELTLPAVPAIPGEYTLRIHFDGMLVAQLPLNISE